MEKYIIIAHPDDFVCGALLSFLKLKGFLGYQLESEDDLNYKKEDLKPVYLVIHENFKHKDHSIEEIVSLFDVKTYKIKDSFDPSALSLQIQQELESN